MRVPKLFHRAFWEGWFNNLLFIVILLVDGFHWLWFISKTNPLNWFILYLHLGRFNRFRSEGYVACSYHGNLVVAEDNCVFGMNFTDLPAILTFLRRELICIWWLIVGEILFFKVVIVRPHLIFTLLLRLRRLSSNFLAIVINFIGGSNFIRIVRPQFEVMSLQLLQLLVVQFGFVNVLPSPIEHLVSSGKCSLLSYV